MRIREISADNRPRERLENFGVEALSEAELLAIILQNGTFGENVIDMCNRLLSKYSISELSKCSLKELQEIKGIGKAKACQILSLFEFNKRYKISNNSKVIKSAKDVYDFVYPKLANKDKEHFLVLNLDTKNKIINDYIVSIGILNASVIHPREIFKNAIKDSANSIILVHNHPSGDSEPSAEDEQVTEKIFEAGELLNIKVLDHVIIGKDNYHSFVEFKNRKII